MLEENETTCKGIIPRLATISENRWNKKLAPEKLKLIHYKYKRSVRYNDVSNDGKPGNICTIALLSTAGGFKCFQNTRFCSENCPYHSLIGSDCD